MFPYIMRRMVRVRNSTMSPEFQLNSLFHSVPVKGDYKLSKKNEIPVDLFLNTLFHAVPPQSPLPPFRSFLPTNFASSFHFFYSSLSAHRFPQSRGHVRGHLAQPRCRAWATWQQRPLLLGDLSLGAKLSPSPPSPLAPLWRKPLQGCFNGGLWALSPLRQQSLDAVTRRVTLGTHQREKGGK